MKPFHNFQNRKSIKKSHSMYINGTNGKADFAYPLDKEQKNFLEMILDNDIMSMLHVDTYMREGLVYIVKRMEYRESDLTLLNIVRERYISDIASVDKSRK